MKRMSPPQIDLYDIYSICEYIINNNSVPMFDFKDENTTIFSGMQFINHLKKVYAYFSFPSIWDNKKSEEDNILTAYSDFLTTFEDWKNQNLYGFIRYYKDLQMEYNAIENYDRFEEGGWTDELHKGSRTATNSNLKNATATNSITTPVGETITTEYINGEDNTNELQTGKSVTSFNNASTTTSGSKDENYTELTGLKENNYSETTDISDSLFDNNKRIFNGYRIHGNIGVSTPADMLTKEKEIRINSFITYAMDDFANKYLVLVGGCCD